MKRIIEKTDDGSATLFVPELNEHYHSTKGALTESQHIFIEMGLKESKVSAPRVLEIGFGTGLNAWLTLVEADKSGRTIQYTGLELYPLEWAEVAQLGYIGKDARILIGNDEQSAYLLFENMHSCAWETSKFITPHFSLLKTKADANIWLKEQSQSYFDVIYFDAFAPEKQPEMWSQELFNELYVLMNAEGILTTYCAKGVVRRMLQAAGFLVERIPGPPGGKREILRARKESCSKQE